MKQVIHTDLPALAQPFSWAVRAGGMVFTTHGPVKPDGRMELGPIDLQVRLSLDNLRRALQAAGGDMTDVAQVLIYLTDIADLPTVDAVYREHFQAPYPNRSAVAVSALAVPGMRIELVVYACIATAPSALRT
jgi:enamine deaminase RidA (YjgF/YER057c/UK114 family)